MASAYVWPADLAAGKLPPICVKTGAPAETAVHVNYSTSPGWTFLTLFFSLFAFILVRLASARRAAGVLPVSLPVARRVRLARRVPVGLMFVAVVLILFAILLGDQVPEAGVTAVVVAMVLVLVGLIALLAVDGYPVRGQVVDEPTGLRWVVLHGVHPAFAAAVTEHYAAGVTVGPPMGAH